MKRNIKFLALTAICCLSLSCLVPSCTMMVDAAGNNGGGTVQPQQEIIEWVYYVNKEELKLYKALYNHTTAKYVTDWIFVRDLTPEEVEELLKP